MTTTVHCRQVNLDTPGQAAAPLPAPAPQDAPDRPASARPARHVTIPGSPAGTSPRVQHPSSAPQRRLTQPSPPRHQQHQQHQQRASGQGTARDQTRVGRSPLRGQPPTSPPRSRDEWGAGSVAETASVRSDAASHARGVQASRDRDGSGSPPRSVTPPSGGDGSDNDDADGAAAPADSPPPKQLTVSELHGWTMEWDARHKRHYFFNVDTRDSLWLKPAAVARVSDEAMLAATQAYHQDRAASRARTKQQRRSAGPGHARGPALARTRSGRSVASRASQRSAPAPESSPHARGQGGSRRTNGGAAPPPRVRRLSPRGSVSSGLYAGSEAGSRDGALTRSALSPGSSPGRGSTGSGAVQRTGSRRSFRDLGSDAGSDATDGESRGRRGRSGDDVDGRMMHGTAAGRAADVDAELRMLRAEVAQLREARDDASSSSRSLKQAFHKNAALLQAQVRSPHQPLLRSRVPVWGGVHSASTAGPRR